MQARSGTAVLAAGAALVGSIGFVTFAVANATPAEEPIAVAAHSAAAPAAPVEPEDSVAAPAVAAPAVVVAAPAAAPRSSAAAEDAAYDAYVARQARIVAAIDTFWVRALRDAGVRYNSPSVRVAARGEKLKSKCGQAVADPVEARKAYPAFYCRSERSVNLSSGWLFRVMDSRFSEGGAAAVIAHEFGHHVQRSIGIADASTRRQEIQADCLAGIFLRIAVNNGLYSKGDAADARRALKSLGDTKYESDVHHGTPKERGRWFDRGYDSGDAYVCNH